MAKETLKKWRIIIPGVIILLFIIPGFTENKEEFCALYTLIEKFTLTDSIYLILVIVFGAIYYLANIRWWLWRHFNEQVRENIKDTLLNLSSMSLSAQQWYELKKGNTLINIFYYFVDNDESLKEKSKSVRLNGLIWSSCFDITILAVVAAAIYSLLAVFMDREHYFIIAVIMFWLCFIFLALSSHLTSKHINLSNEQLEVIKQRMRSELDEKIKQEIKNDI